MNPNAHVLILRNRQTGKLVEILSCDRNGFVAYRNLNPKTGLPRKGGNRGGLVFTMEFPTEVRQ